MCLMNSYWQTDCMTGWVMADWNIVKNVFKLKRNLVYSSLVVKSPKLTQLHAKKDHSTDHWKTQGCCLLGDPLQWMETLGLLMTRKEWHWFASLRHRNMNCISFAWWQVYSAHFSWASFVRYGYGCSPTNNSVGAVQYKFPYSKTS
jgi:hypothetical protein